MKSLTKEESFQIMTLKFAQLRVHQIIDLCHDNERFPALILEVDHLKRTFSYLRLDKMTSKIAQQADEENTKTVLLPSVASEVHPMWNLVGK